MNPIKTFCKVGTILPPARWLLASTSGSTITTFGNPGAVPLRQEREALDAPQDEKAAEQMAKARKRHDDAAATDFEELAPLHGYRAEEAPRELPVEPWKHLVARRHPWRRQLFIKGRNMTVRQLIGTV